MRLSSPRIWAFAVLLIGTYSVQAGLYYSGETYADLPSRWRGFLLDQRNLRNVAVRPSATAPIGPIRKQYEAEAKRLTALAGQRKLSADEAADLGAVHVRLGDPARALSVLRPAQREHPDHFRIAANLGTAWQMQGNGEQARLALERAVKLAPEALRSAEQLHLKLVRQRARPTWDANVLDDLFGIRFVGPSGRFEAGTLAANQRERLPADAIALVQRLALWLPADGLLLWQLAELAGAGGDVSTAAAMLDGCVTEFGIRSAQLRSHRQEYRAAADRRSKSPDADAKNQHAAGHVPLFKPRSVRPLARKLDQTPLPPIDPHGVNALPWTVLVETTLDAKYHPTFPGYLRELDGKKVTLQGFMHPLRDDAEQSAFLLVEYPVGCWYCEQPETTAIVLVVLPEDNSQAFTRGPLRVRGRLVLNSSDPERFLYAIRDAEVEKMD